MSASADRNADVPLHFYYAKVKLHMSGPHIALVQTSSMGANTKQDVPNTWGVRIFNSILQLGGCQGLHSSVSCFFKRNNLLTRMKGVLFVFLVEGERWYATVAGAWFGVFHNFETKARQKRRTTTRAMLPVLEAARTTFLSRY